ncbi:zinc-binding dehydrogenase [Parafilimonas sp.]|uniref:zinc-binding dehydrogenase n=1 Tax=Parafilimonas sp. TaxID=1969739 RepID=UPI0039E379AF
MLGFCIAYNFPVISIVRKEEGRKELEALGANNILMQNDDDFRQQLQQISQQLNATAIFDGVGGAALSNIIDVVPFNSTICSYGFLDKQMLFSFNTSILMKGIAIKGFSNFRTQTVMNANNLEQALKDISNIIHQPHFITKTGKNSALKKQMKH